ncbi:unnamed protein product [Ceratitis capitata]|uniref:(Mediterranean fruit fly) hypothetical protein n=1 Tax=Ceratitis capitata TaxID=7213 RepID=A0A811UGI5_CERCA|nr:unnamed protein product [Ceratitis capitata]
MVDVFKKTLPDSLVLCKACFRQVEATASLSKIAKTPQKVFRDFIFSTKSCLQAESIDVSSPTIAPVAAAVPTPVPTPTKECTPIVQIPERPKSKEQERPIVQSAESKPPASLPASSNCSHKDEVILNVSVNDPLTRETQHKMITASRRQNSLDSRFTPKSIAQRSFTQSTPKQAESMSAEKKQMTSGVINFFPNRKQQQVTTIHSGGYVIGAAPETLQQPAYRPS